MSNKITLRVEYRISPFSSLNFDHAWKLPFQVDACYIQKFLPTDNIRIQYNTSNLLNFEARLVNLSNGQSTVLPAEIIEMGEHETGNEILITALYAGAYSFELYIILEQKILVESSSFCIYDELPDTKLYSYTNYRSEFRTDFDESRLFDFRVESSFLPSEVAFPAETNGFRNQEYGYDQLSAGPYRTDVLTIGGKSCHGYGVPNWVGEKMNYIFSLSFVLIDGQRWVRSDGSSPEVNVLNTSYPLFIYKLQLEKDTEYTAAPTFGYIKVSPQRVVFGNTPARFLLESSHMWVLQTGPTDLISISLTQGQRGRHLITATGIRPGQGTFTFRNVITGQTASIYLIYAVDRPWILEAGNWNDRGFWYDSATWNDA